MLQLARSAKIQPVRLPAAGGEGCDFMVAGGFAHSCQALRLRLYLLLFLSDSLAIIAGFLAAGAFRLGSPLEDQCLNTVAIVLPIFTAIAFNNRSYSLRVLQKPAAGAAKACAAITYAIAIAFAVLFYMKVSVQFSRLIFGVGTGLSIFTLISSRLLIGREIGRTYRWRFANRLVIVDGVPVVPQPGDHLIFPETLGIDPESNDPMTLDRLGTALENCDSVLLACHPERRRAWSYCLKGTAAELEIPMPELAELGATRLKRRHGQTTLVVGTAPLGLRDRILKRTLDVVLSMIALSLLLPLMAFVAIAIKVESPGPTIFRQQRVGRNNRLFYLLKFRSMKAEETDLAGVRSASVQDDRMTRVGRFIRRTSIDELPQLFNVLAGDMSIVGPRPHALGSTAENVRFWEVDKRYFHRHAIKPGITGLAQIRGFRGATTKRCDLSNRLRCDLEYLAGWTLWRDLTIIARTFRVLVHPNAY